MGELLDTDTLPLWADGLIVLVTIAVLWLGAHWVVESASRIAKRLGISELIIGLTVVALGTSAPEFAVTLMAAFEDHGDISVGNIVGSNIFNLGFILGGCALLHATPISPTLIRRDGMVIGGATLLLLALIGWDLRLDRSDGILLFVLLVVYLGYLYRQRRAEEEVPEVVEKVSLLRDGLLLLVGLVCLVGGSHFLVGSATAIARGFGVSDWVIGVTVVAAGTSAPELATSLSGVLKGRYGISAGNLIGSDIFNVLGVLGVAGMLKPMEIDAVARISLIAMCGMVFLVLCFMRTGWKISRLEGLVLVAVAVLRWYYDFSTGSAES